MERDSQSLHDRNLKKNGEGVMVPCSKYKGHAKPLYHGVHPGAMKCQVTVSSPTSSGASCWKRAGDMSEYNRRLSGQAIYL